MVNLACDPVSNQTNRSRNIPNFLVSVKQLSYYVGIMRVSVYMCYTESIAVVHVKYAVKLRLPLAERSCAPTSVAVPNYDVC